MVVSDCDTHRRTTIIYLAVAGRLLFRAVFGMSLGSWGSSLPSPEVPIGSFGMFRGWGIHDNVLFELQC